MGSHTERYDNHPASVLRANDREPLPADGTPDHGLEAPRLLLLLLASTLLGHLYLALLTFHLPALAVGGPIGRSPLGRLRPPLGRNNLPLLPVALLLALSTLLGILARLIGSELALLPVHATPLIACPVLPVALVLSGPILSPSLLDAPRVLVSAVVVELAVVVSPLLLTGLVFASALFLAMPSFVRVLGPPAVRLVLTFASLLDSAIFPLPVALPLLVLDPTDLRPPLVLPVAALGEILLLPAPLSLEAPVLVQGGEPPSLLLFDLPDLAARLLPSRLAPQVLGATVLLAFSVLHLAPFFAAKILVPT